ncbi:spore germination protein [Alicyclobacillus fodiniaquatilis]|uniref:Spore germination protein n=1 Tax=Alicyclobacillus fodiniaquatilis TaxID=1661150 RepID=A0ABW4JCN6_9BACL
MGKTRHSVEKAQATIDPPHTRLDKSLDKNIETLHGIFHDSFDIVFRPIHLPDLGEILILFVNGLVNSDSLDSAVLKPLIFEGDTMKLRTNCSLHQIIKHQLIAIAQTKTAFTIDEIVMEILSAKVAILADGEQQAIIADLHGFQTRTVTEPSSEVAIRGPKEGFTEFLLTNTSLIRRKIVHPGLKMEHFTLGTVTHTSIAVAYIKDIASEPMVDEVRRRISAIEIDSVIDTAYIEEFIEDATFSPYPTIQNTERPDVVATTLLDGKIAIMADGSPNALIVPVSFWAALQSSEDYYERFIFSTCIRLLRLMMYTISLVLPSFYVAITTYHQQLLPTPLLFSIAAAREGIPFPTMIEALIMEFMFEGLREAGLRLPKPVGPAVSIVGALVIGETAVQAGIVSAPMVIIIALTGICSFAIPKFNFGIAHRLLRFPILIMSGVFGIFGLTMGCIFVLIHLVCLRSFGEPYLSPIAPQIFSEMKDSIVRIPRWMMTTRSEFSESTTNRISQRQPANRFSRRRR